MSSSATSTDLADWSATELLDAFRSRAASPVEALEAVLSRIDRLDPTLNAFVLVDPDTARAGARASERRWREGRPAGRVDGVPTTIKDMFLTRGWPTRRGSRTIPAEGDWSDDSPLVARLREEGAVLVGKTTQSEFGWKGTCDSPLTGVTRNPWDPARTPGGSSGGAAVAAATGMGALHAGGDGAGSVRIPAAFTGVFGLKPSFGRIPNWPAKNPGSITHAGPITRTVADAALMLAVMAGPDWRDWRSLPPPPADWLADIDAGVAGLRVAWSRTLGLAEPDPAVAAACEAALARLAEAGATIEPVEIDLAAVRPAFELYYAIRFTRLCDGLAPAHRALLDPGIEALADTARDRSAVAVLDAEAVREELGFRMRDLHRRFDLLATPQMPGTAFAAGRDTPSGTGSWLDWSPYTYAFNWTGQPAASVPAGLANGLPVALQLVGDRFRDDLVLRAARTLERAAPFVMPQAA